MVGCYVDYVGLLVLTHYHSDHLAGLVEVTRRYRVGQVLRPALDDTSPLYVEWLRLIEEKGIKSAVACAGQRIALGGGTAIEVLSPPATRLEGTESDVDNNSIVLRLSAGNISFLFTEDIMREAEWELIRKRVGLTSTLLKVAHHGADTSTTPGFLAAVSPRLAVFSCGANNSFGHPSKEVVYRIEGKMGTGSIYRTDLNGTIEFVTDGERLWVEAER